MIKKDGGGDQLLKAKAKGFCSRRLVTGFTLPTP